MHRLQISIGRRRYDIREKLSETFPDLFLHVSIDAMDNKKTNIPQARHFSHTKKTAGGEVLKTRIMVLEREGRLPRYCFLQMDNAAKDNKNAFMFAYLSLLVELGWFEQVYVHFLPPGHTHSNLDQKYSVISQALKNKDVFTLDHLITEVGGVFQSMGDYTKQEVVTSIGDFSAVLKDNVYQMYGHGTSLVNGVNRRLHAFKITRQANRQAGVYFKEYDESGHWRGQWDKDSEPILVLSRFPLNKSVPFKDAPKIRIQELQNIEVHWKSILDVISPKDAAEDIADDLSGPDDLAVREYGLDGQDDIPGPAADDLAGTSAGDGAETGEFPADKHFVDFPSALSEFPQLDASRISLGENLIAALDDLSIDLPDILQSEVAKGLKDILTMETELARPPTADLLYLHSSQGTKPDTRASYDPNTDLALGHVAVVKVSVEDSSGERGWDVVEIKSDTVIGEVECVYLMPLYSKRGEALVYTDTNYPEWPSEWMDQKLVPITVKLGRNHKATWTGNIPLDAVQFSCQPTSDMKIPKKYHTSVLLACKAIEDNTRPEAVQSDGDNVDIDGEEEEITAFVDISGISKVVQVNDKTKVNSNLLLTELVGVCNTIISLTNVPECLTDSVDAMKIAYQKFTSCPPTSGGKKKPLQDMLLPIVAAAAAAGAFASAAAAAAAAAATDAPSSLSEEGSGSGSGSIGNKRSRRGVPTVPAVHAATPAASTTVFTAAPAATPSSGTATSGFAFSTGSPSSSLAPGRVGTRRGPLKNELPVGTIVGAFTIVGYSPALTCTAVTSHGNPCSRQQVLYSTTTGGPSFTTGKCSHMSCMKQTPSQREAYLATKQVYQKYLRPNAKFIDSRYFKEAERTAEKIRSAGEVVETFIAAPPQYIAAPPQ
eukprot:gene18631-biopygen27549